MCCKGQQWILFGAGGAGIRVLYQLKKNSVDAFCDNYKAGQIVEGKPVIDIITLKNINVKGQYRIMICASLPHIACEIA